MPQTFQRARSLTPPRVLTLLLWIPLLACPLGCSSSPDPTLPGQGSGPADEPWSPATFDLYAMFGDHQLSPARGGEVVTGFQVRNISDDPGEVALEIESGSGIVDAEAATSVVSLEAVGDKREVPLTLRLKPGAPEGAEDFVRVLGRRAGEEHEIYFRVVSLTSAPRLELGRYEGEVQEQAFRVTNGEPVDFLLFAANLGAARDAFPLGWEAPDGWEVRFLDANGALISEVEVDGLTQNYLLEQYTPFVARVVPPAGLEKNRPVEIRLILGPGRTGSQQAASLSVQVMESGMLASSNDLDGPTPHVHRIFPGARARAITTFVLRVHNPAAGPADVKLALDPVEPGWAAELSTGSLPDLAPGASGEAVLSVRPPHGALPGQEARFTVRARHPNGESDRVRLGARVSGARKVYFWAIDSMSEPYLRMNRQGTGPGREGDWLCPNLHAFMDEALDYANARTHLPSVTDNNHSNALSGTMSGTVGLYQVSGSYVGTDAHRRIHTCPMTADLLRHGPDGERVDRVFEVARSQDPGALCALFSNKKWVAVLHDDPEDAVQRIVHGSSYPVYADRPPLFFLGEKPSPNLIQIALLEVPLQEILLPSLRGELAGVLDISKSLSPIGKLVGDRPGEFCPDAWLAGTLLDMIREEDPDVVYVNLAELDDVQHLIGCSAFPEKWDDGLLPALTDDRHVYNPTARRNSSIETLREADAHFGRLTALLEERGAYDESIVVLLADHGQHNYKHAKKGYKMLDIRKELRQRGILMGEDYEFTVSLVDYSIIYAPDPDACARIERELESLEVDDTDLGPVRPLVVLNRSEMRSGVEETDPERRGTRYALPGELYSEYYTRPAAPGSRRQRWPDLLAFTVASYAVLVNGDQLRGSMNPTGMSLGNAPAELSVTLTGGHGGFDTAHVPLIVKLPGVPGGRQVEERAYISDIAPTVYRAQGWPVPDFVDGRPLPVE